MAATFTLVELAGRVGNLARALGPQAFTPIWPIVAQMAVSDVRKNFQEGHAPDGRPWKPLAHGRAGQGGGALPLRDNGVLLASITGKAIGNGIAVGTNVVYAALHQFGGVVRPKKAKFLAIPLTKEAKRAGSPRKFPGNPKWRFIPTKTGGWVMLAAPPSQQRAANRRTIADALATLEGRTRRRNKKPAPVAIAQYVLVSEVTVPARPFLGFSDSFIDRVGQLLTDRIGGLVGGALLGGN